MIGIIVAMEEELQELLKVLNNKKETKYKDLGFYTGTISNRKCIVSKSGVGKVNSARTTTIMIEKYNPQKIINLGVAGSCTEDLNIGDVVIADKLYQHDFDVTIFNHNLGYIPRVGDFIKCDIDNKKLLIETLSKTFNSNIFIGAIASGDKFIYSKEEKLKINSLFKALCCDMEGASIAQVCYLSNIPFLFIRSISDTINNNIKEEYETFLETSSKKSVKFLQEYLKIEE